MTTRLSPGAVVAGRELESVTGAPVHVPDPARLTHLQFRRFAGCPVCHLHLRSFVRRHDEIAAAGVREVVLFHSPAGELREHAAGLPFAVVADPEKRLYREFGVESAPRALLDPRAFWPILRAIAHGLPAVVARRQPLPSPDPQGGRLGLPADLLIASDGRVLAAKYGEHVDDQWSVDTLLTLTGTERNRRPPGDVVSEGGV
ncbi:alkyl hydroperoxide reductase [Sorangium cellulosum]|uniref:Alkyl hydroperoxide reductase n=1 Tax=Sorangium cellulosum TaxID=56 RepID=A0A2L0FBF0_SORCE|nr:peroxiredoxin-like family protein [Sorangium cellulosum]AUX48851.1 alkyl hydroperoxide reductase [Sorangium cellulosum]